MAQPRPSLTLVLDIDERLDTEELRLEIGRCYAHVCLTLVRTHKPGEGAGAIGAGANEDAPVNVARFLVKMGTKNYLDSSVEGADELWSGVLAQWFENEFYKVGNNLRIFNRRQAEQENPELDISWIEVELQNGELTCRLHCDNLGGIDAVGATRALSAARGAYNAGELGSAQDIACVVMPSPASWEAQMEAGCAAHAELVREQEAERLARDEAEAARRAAEEAAADEAFLASPELEREAEADAAGPDEIDEEAMRERMEEMFELESPWFDVDYTACEAVRADGSKAAWTWDDAASHTA